ncbi:RICIN domain-containing protein [Streptomyces sp. NPDC055109]
MPRSSAATSREGQNPRASARGASQCSFQCSNGTDAPSTTRRSSTPAKTCTIESGTGRLLAQVRSGSATTYLAGGASSPSSRWKFTSNGDGSYRIANASTGGLLGVDATSDAGRAWGAKPTVTAAPAGGPAVGQQWLVVPSTTSGARQPARTAWSTATADSS